MRWLALLATATVAAAAAPGPVLEWPTSVQVQRDGSLLVVENGKLRVDRIDPHTGKVRVVATGFSKPVCAVRARNGDLLVSDDTALRRITPAGTRTVVATRGSQIGWVAVAGDGRIAYTTETAAYLVGRAAPIATSLAGPHGIAFAGTAILVSDTGHDRVLRIANGRVTPFTRLTQPRGIAVGASVYVVSGHRVVRVSPLGKRLGTRGPSFADPYTVALGAGGVLYVVDTAAAGRVVRVG